MTRYTCLQCGVDFPSTNTGKFHSRDCYNLYRKTHTDTEIKNTPAIVLKQSEPRVKKPEVKTKPDVTPITPKVSEELNFDNLTISEIKEELKKSRTARISDVDMEEIKRLISKVIEILNAIEAIPETEPPQRAALKPTITYPLRECQYCHTNFRPEYNEDEQLFCSNECAACALKATNTGTLIRPDGTLISAGRF